MPWRWRRASVQKCWHSDMRWACGSTSGSSWSTLLQWRRQDVLCATRSAAVDRQEMNGVCAAVCVGDGCISPAHVWLSIRSMATFVSSVPHSTNSSTRVPAMCAINVKLECGPMPNVMVALLCCCAETATALHVLYWLPLWCTLHFLCTVSQFQLLSCACE